MRYTVKIVFRILTFPFVAGIGLIATIRLFAFWCINFLLYGGELIEYTKDRNPNTISKLIDKMVAPQKPFREHLAERGIQIKIDESVGNKTWTEICNLVDSIYG